MAVVAPRCSFSLACAFKPSTGSWADTNPVATASPAPALATLVVPFFKADNEPFFASIAGVHSQGGTTYIVSETTSGTRSVLLNGADGLYAPATAVAASSYFSAFKVLEQDTIHKDCMVQNGNGNAVCRIKKNGATSVTTVPSVVTEVLDVRNTAPTTNAGGAAPTPTPAGGSGTVAEPRYPLISRIRSG
ncbi:hypothetical protein C8J57DRAFT_1255891 [Mycena rebaudengoi]|nr:hypothetical protein C8J57DRAFT_1255891 [Mycena rebaudengoi]